MTEELPEFSLLLYHYECSLFWHPVIPKYFNFDTFLKDLLAA
jgi:hypothetical protein